MTATITVLGSIFCLISLFVIVFPQWVLRVGQRVTISTPLRLIAFVVRVLLGIIITLAAGSTQFPLTLKIIGILSIVSGVTALLLGNSKSQSLLDVLHEVVGKLGPAQGSFGTPWTRHQRGGIGINITLPLRAACSVQLVAIA